MRKYTVLFASLLALQSFAAVSGSSSTDSDDTSFKQCETIVNACQSAGYQRQGPPGKDFWHNCLEPLMLGKTVTGVNVDQKDVDACRKFKIKKMQTELKELQHVRSK